MKVTLTGIDDVNAMLEKIAPRHARNIMRATIHGMAGSIRDDAKKFMSEDTGTMKKATKAKRERAIRGYLWSTVRVHPDAKYWRYREYGQGPDGVADAMFMKAVEIYRRDMDRNFVEQFGKKWEAALARAAKRAA